MENEVIESLDSARARVARRLARWLGERDGVHSSGDFKLNPKYEAYLEEAEELVDMLPSLGFYQKLI